MATNLDLLSGPNTIFVSVYSDDERATESLLACESKHISDQSLQSFCQQAEEALEKVLSSQVGLEDWRELLRVGRSISAVLPERKWRALTEQAVSGSPPLLTLRLHGHLVAVPWEMLYIGKERLLGEVFDVGRQIVAPSSHLLVTPRRTLHEPINVLIVADSDLPYALQEGQQLHKSFEEYGARFKVTFLTDLTTRDLLRELPYVDILHFAGDAEADPQHPDKTGWRLRQDEWFDCEAIETAGIEHWPVLVFANACRTAHIVRRLGDWGLDGLAFSLLKHGVRHYISTVARLPDTDMVVRFALCFYEALLERKAVGAALREARQHISRDTQGQEDIYGRMVAANYLHYGNPGGYLFEAPQPAVEQNAELEALIDGMTALLQGRTEEARRHFGELRQQPNDANVAKRLDDLLREVDEDQARRQEVQHILKERHGPVSTPTRIGPYELTKEIGHGTYRTVYLAHSFKGTVPASEVAVALPYYQHDDNVQRQCEAFRWLQPKVQHPGLVRIHDVDIYDGLFCVVYELVTERSLAERLSERPAPWPMDEVYQLVERIGSALDTAHKHGIVHGEMTPHDILITADGTAKLLDVGRAQTLRRASLRPAPPEQSERYRAPEQWMLSVPRTDPSADTWALAALSYELLVGHHPFEHAIQDGDWSQAILKSLPYPPSLHRPDLPAGVAQALLRALARNPEDRYSSASAFVQALCQAHRGLPRVGGFEPDLELALETGAPLLYVETEDETSSLERLQAIAARLQRSFYTWRLTSGITQGIDPNGASLGYVSDPLGALNWLSTLERPAILALLDYDVYLDEIPSALDLEEHFREAPGASSWNPPPDHGKELLDRTDFHCHSSTYHDRTDRRKALLVLPKEQIQRRLKDLACELKTPSGLPRAAVILASITTIPDELTKDVQLFLPLPIDALEVEELLREAAVPGGAENLEVDISEYTLHAIGLSTSEVRDSLRLSVARRGTLTPNCLSDLQRDKEQIVRRRGLLELWHPSVTFDDVVGLDELKEWFEALHLFIQGPVAAGLLPPPKGVLLGGMPGCGKSLCAQAMAGTLGWPLLRLDVGRIFGGQLGQSERNMRTALSLAAEMSPVVMWVDEVEKGFGQLQGSAASGTTLRVFQTFLTWLQEHTDCIFLVATANDQAGLPSELLRAGRFNALFFLDLPNTTERAELIRHYLRQHERSVDGHDFSDLAKQTAWFSSAELAARVINALYIAAQHRRLEPTPAELRAALTTAPSPLAQRQRKHWEEVRQLWLNLARPASPLDSGLDDFSRG